ncbi:MAG: HDIG domain-containing protein [Planctomycetota bacterium]|nr:HDIG domain-containing protein [Planctomycetota bacterium]
MNWIELLRARLKGGHHLRRVSPEKARSTESRNQRPSLEQVGEKIVLAAMATLLAMFLLGLGALARPREWCALAALLTLSCMGLAAYLRDFRPTALRSIPRLVGLSSAIILPLAVLFLSDQALGEVDLAWLPVSLVSLILALAWGRALALEAVVVAGGLLAAYLALHDRLEGPDLSGLVVALGGGVMAALGAKSVKRRADLFRIGVMIGCIQVALSAGFMLMSPEAPGMGELADLVRVLIVGVVVGLLVSGLLPMVEALLDVTTDISLLELGNTHSSPLLRKLLIEAPGTFHHSYVVGLLAEGAAVAINGDALLARVGALYHDVGKLNKPEYFAENSPAARDRHKNLAPEMSMLIISAHTRDGVELGRYYGLPNALLAFMVEHHGTSCIEYFYQQAVKLRGEDQVSEGTFRYSGRRPQSKEAAIVMIADAAEAIARQMTDPSIGRLQEMVHRVSMKRLMDSQFSECALTLAELATIERAIVQVLSAIHHTRPTFAKGKPNPLDLSRSPQGEPEEGAGADSPSKPGKPGKVPAKKARGSKAGGASSGGDSA